MAGRYLILLAVFLFALPLTGIAAPGVTDYVLGAGDKVRIQVYGEDDMTVQSLIGDSGTISYPFLGEIRAGGQTVKGLEEFITGKLKGPYFVNPDVTVSIIEYRQFYVNGRVQQPGGFPFQPGMTVGKAITLAGGFDERANRDKIYIVHSEDPDARPVPARQDTRVRPGDIITVERSFF